MPSRSASAAGERERLGRRARHRRAGALEAHTAGGRTVWSGWSPKRRHAGVRQRGQRRGAARVAHERRGGRHRLGGGRDLGVGHAQHDRVAARGALAAAERALDLDAGVAKRRARARCRPGRRRLCPPAAGSLRLSSGLGSFPCRSTPSSGSGRRLEDTHERCRQPQVLGLGPCSHAAQRSAARSSSSCTGRRPRASAARSSKTRTKVVFGSGNADADLMFVGEAPGMHEDQQGLPFVGRAGQLLNKLLEEIGLAREDVFIANVLQSRPPGNRDPAAGRDRRLQAVPAPQDRADRAAGDLHARQLLDQAAHALAARDHERARAPAGARARRPPAARLPALPSRRRRCAARRRSRSCARTSRGSRRCSRSRRRCRSAPWRRWPRRRAAPAEPETPPTLFD